jgi:hypothetical protein
MQALIRTTASAASSTHALVQRHPDQQRERVAAEQLVG